MQKICTQNETVFNHRHCDELQMNRRIQGNGSVNLHYWQWIWYFGVVSYLPILQKPLKKPGWVKAKAIYSRYITDIACYSGHRQDTSQCLWHICIIQNMCLAKVKKWSNTCGLIHRSVDKKNVLKNEILTGGYKTRFYLDLYQIVFEYVCAG